MNAPNIKEEARRLVETLTEDSTWDDLMEQIYARMAIEQGLRESREGRTVDVQDVRARFGLKP